MRACADSAAGRARAGRCGVKCAIDNCSEARWHDSYLCQSHAVAFSESLESQRVGGIAREQVPADEWMQRRDVALRDWAARMLAEQRASGGAA